jgi:spermidine synthase
MNQQRTPILLALFLSGFAGLMHEIVWARLLVNLIGNTAHAQAVVLTVFMGGLALGAVLFGRRSDRGRAPLRIYVALEVLIGVYCLLLPMIVHAAGVGYDALAAQWFESIELKFALRFALAILVVLLPALLMGGTLPVLARHLVEEVSQTRRQVALLYALNNLGAVLGAGVAGFWTLPSWGIFPSLAVASALNFAAAALVWSLANQPAAPQAVPVPDRPAEALPAYGADQFRLTLFALALSGFAAMGYEVVFTRIIALSFGSSAYSFTVMLMAFITGIGVGSALLTRRRIERPLWLFGASQIAVVISLLAATVIVTRLPYWIALLRIDLVNLSSGYALYQVGKAALILFVLLIPTACIGFGFPLVAQIQARALSDVGSNVGSTYAWNTVGNVLGVLATSLVLIPAAALGIRGAFEVLVGLNLLAAVLVLWMAREQLPAMRIGALAAGLLACALYVPFGRGWPDPINRAGNHLRLHEGPPKDAPAATKAAHPSASFANWKKEFVLRPEDWQQFFLEEEADTTVLACARLREALLFVNGKGDASTGINDMITQLLLGHLPMLMEPDAKQVLVIGLGSGVTAGSAMLHGVQSMDVVEISSGVLHAEKLFSRFNHQILQNPKVRVWRDDARTFLRTVPKKYDVIISEPSNPWIAGVGNLFTQEFFEDGRDRLNPGGLMCIWFHQYEQSDEAVKLVLRTVDSVFPHVSMFLSYYGDVIALASMEPLAPDFARMEASFNRREVRQDLVRIGVFNLAQVLTHHAISPKRFHALAGEGPLNRDLHQRLEYLAGRSLFEQSEATLISHAQGFEQLPGGATDSLFDSYLEWRRAQNDPLTTPELEQSANWIRGMLDAQHRLVTLIASRVAQGHGDPPPGASPARGGTVPMSEMDYPEAFNHAILAARKDDKELAIAYFRRALELEPAHPQATFQLANILISMQRLDEAGEAILKVLQVHPDDHNLKCLVATIYAQQERFEDSRRMCQEIIEHEEHPKALTLLGNIVEVHDGNPVNALDLYRRAFEKDPNCWEAAYRSAIILGQSEATAGEAVRTLERALANNPGNTMLQELRAQFP